MNGFGNEYGGRPNVSPSQSSGMSPNGPAPPERNPFPRLRALLGNPGWLGGAGPQKPPEPEFDYRPYSNQFAEYGQVDPQVADYWLAGLDPQIANTATLDLQQMQRANEERRRWFDMWRQMMNQNYMHAADTIRSMRGGF